MITFWQTLWNSGCSHNVTCRNASSSSLATRLSEEVFFSLASAISSPVWSRSTSLITWSRSLMIKRYSLITESRSSLYFSLSFAALSCCVLSRVVSDCSRSISRCSSLFWDAALDSSCCVLSNLQQIGNVSAVICGAKKTKTICKNKDRQKPSLQSYSHRGKVKIGKHLSYCKASSGLSTVQKRL